MIVELWGCDINVQFSKHAERRIIERNILKEIVMEDLKTAENELGELKSEQIFAIIDKLTKTTIVGQFIDEGETIEIITVINKAENFKTKYKTDVIIYIN